MIGCDHIIVVVVCLDCSNTGGCKMVGHRNMDVCINCEMQFEPVEVQE